MKKKRKQKQSILGGGFNPVEVDEIRAKVDEVITTVLNERPELAKSKFIGPMLKGFIYSRVLTSEGNRIALLSQSCVELLNVVMPDLPDLAELVSAKDGPVLDSVRKGDEVT